MHVIDESKKSSNLVIQETDIYIFCALYKHRFLNANMIYNLVHKNPHLVPYKNNVPYNAASLPRRLKKLEDNGYLGGFIYRDRVWNDKKVETVVNLKFYHLNRQSLGYVISYLGLNFNIYNDYNRPTKKFHLEQNEFMVDDKTKQSFAHHFCTQRVISQSIEQIINQSSSCQSFLDLIYGDGKFFTLNYTFDDSSLIIYPDMAMFKTEEITESDTYYLQTCDIAERSRYLTENKSTIALEIDRTTETGLEFISKIMKYKRYIADKKKKLAEKPLYLIFVVERTPVISKEKRITNITQKIIEMLQIEIRQNLVIPFVVDEMLSPTLISKIVLSKEKGEETIESGLEEARNTLQRVVQDVNDEYELSVEMSKKDSLLENDAPYSRRYLFASGDYDAPPIEVFLQFIQPGDVQAELNLIEAEKYLNRRNIRGCVIGIYENEEGLFNRVQEDYLIDDVNGKKMDGVRKTIFTTIDNLKKGVGWVYELSKDYPPMLRKGTINHDVLKKD